MEDTDLNQRRADALAQMVIRQPHGRTSSMNPQESVAFMAAQEWARAAAGAHVNDPSEFGSMVAQVYSKALGRPTPADLIAASSFPSAEDVVRMHREMTVRHQYPGDASEQGQP